jgi:hypothetical protein
LKVLRTSAGNFSIFTLFKSMVPKCFQYTRMSKLCNTTCSSGTPFCKRGDRVKKNFGFLDLFRIPRRVSAEGQGLLLMIFFSHFVCKMVFVF